MFTDHLGGSKIGAGDAHNTFCFDLDVAEVFRRGKRLDLDLTMQNHHGNKWDQSAKRKNRNSLAVSLLAVTISSISSSFDVYAASGRLILALSSLRFANPCSILNGMVIQSGK